MAKQRWLNAEQEERLRALRAGKGNRGGKSLFVHQKGNTKITAKQVQQVKDLFAQGKINKDIQVVTKLSEWIISGVKRGRYAYMEE